MTLELRNVFCFHCTYSISTGDQSSLIQQLDGPLSFCAFRLIFASSLPKNCFSFILVTVILSSMGISIVIEWWVADNYSYIQILDNRMVRVNFKNSPPPHEFQAWRVTKCLCLHEPNSFEKMHIRKQLTFLMIWLHNWIVIISNPTFPCWRTNQTCQIQEHMVMNLDALIFGP